MSCVFFTSNLKRFYTLFLQKHNFFHQDREPSCPASYPQIHCTDSLYETAFLHELSAHPSPPPFGRYLSRRERQGLCANLKQNDKPKFTAPSIDAHRTLGSPSIHRHPPGSWLSLRESWREAPERAHCTDSTYNLPTEPPHRFYPQTAPCAGDYRQAAPSARELSRSD